jgi:YD repeat-containing protein
VTAPLARVTRYAYDAEGKVTSILDPLQQTTTQEWTPDRQLKKVIEPNGAYLEYACNANGLITDEWDQLRNHELHLRAPPGRRRRRQRRMAARTHDPAPEPGRQPHRAEGQCDGDADDRLPNPLRLRRRRQPDYDHRPRRRGDHLHRHPDGTVAAVTDANSRSTQYTDYDANGLATRSVDAKGNVETRGYDDDGLLRWTQDALHQSYSGGETREYRTTHDYDAFHRLGRISAPKSTGAQRGILIWHAWEQDANDNPVAESLPVYGGAAGATAPETTRSFDAMDRQTLETSADTSATRPGSERR